MAYSNDTLEEGLKNQVARDYFPSYDCTEIKGKIDFCVHLKSPVGQNELFDQSLYWAEAKKGEANPYESLVQLILTIGKARAYNEYLPPPFLGAFDARLIAFLPYTAIRDIFNKNDFNWNVTPSNHDTKEFKELYSLVEDTLKEKSLLFYYDRDGYALREFIKKNFYEGAKNVSKITIDKNNFTAIYARWREKVMPTIICDWEEFFGLKIMDADFYLADLLSRDDITIKEKLAVLLESNKYKVSNEVLSKGKVKSLFVEGYFNDGMKAHKEFWRIYERPPAEEYWDYIVARRDLLVPQDIRERKGSFFTPQKWVTLSQQYIAKALGEDWQEKYVIWDPCAGTGNLLAGLTEKYNIYASTIDKQDVDVMHDRIANGATLLDSHVFQFDFLNDDFASVKVPESLRKILNNKEKLKQLVIYMNPPYAEVSSKIVSSDGTKGKAGVNQTMVHDMYDKQLGTAGRELFVQFLIRIYHELNGCVIANFSTLKLLQGKAFATMRRYFKPQLKSLFLMPAFTFDNVKGQFPIGFHIWDTSVDEPFKQIEADVYGADSKLNGQKTIALDDNYINKWISQFKVSAFKAIGYMDGINGNDFQHNDIVYVVNDKSAIPNPRGIWINKDNIIKCCIFFSVRHVIPHTWLNHNDQFLYPNDGWMEDTAFQNDCLVYTLFHAKNCISSKQGTNHWIPFTASEVHSHDRFDSTFVTDFIKPLAFTPAACAVFDAGREMWRYYHAQDEADVNAALYDIRRYFQGEDARGNLNAQGGSAEYKARLVKLRGALDTLAEQIEGKVYQYEFLKK